MDTTSSYGPSLAKMLAAFPSAREKHNGYYEHSDNPRFDFRVREDGSIFIHSWTGRGREEILAMGGLKESDISLRGQTYTGPTKDSLDLLDLAIAKCIHPHFLENLGLQSGYVYYGRRYIRIPYHFADGAEHTKIKVRCKVEGEGKHYWDTDTPGEYIPYGMHKLDMARTSGYLLVGEGESDGWTCWYNNVPYLGIPGADRQKVLKHLDVNMLPPKVYILLEPDQKQKLLSSGQGFYKNVHQELRKIGYAGEIFCIDFKKATGHKDPSDLHIALWKEQRSEQFQEIIHRTLKNAIADGNSPEQSLCDFSADDAGNGEAMYQLFGRVFTYNEAVGWMYYTGTHWEVDEGLARLTKAAIETLRKRRHTAVDAGMESIVKATVSDTKRINGAITCFRAHVVASIDTFDAEEHLLNCKNGVVNLKTGELTPHSEDQRFTYCVPVEYKPVDATEWIDYLHGVVGGGDEMINYLQLALGYSLTGSTREECLFYVYGPSRSGKGTVAEIILRLLPRPLSTMVDFNSFTAKREGDVSNFDLAELKPSRVVFASESQRNQSLNPAKIKQLTGGDLVRASFKHKNFFTYRPQFKVWMLSNWPVNGDPEDDALWGRVRVIPFPNSYLGKEDKGKKERLKSDEVLTSILHWAVQGAMKWYALGSRGLQTPAYVADVTKAQRDAQDFVQQWLSECCVEDGEAWTPNEVVIASYNQWCETNNVTAKKAKALAQSLQMKGFETGVLKRMGAKVQKGVKGLKIPTTLWVVQEKCNGSSYVTDVTPKSDNFPKSIREDEFPISSVTSVTEDQSVTNHQQPEETNILIPVNDVLDNTSHLSMVSSESAMPISLEAFWSIGKKYGYPEIADLGLKSGKLEWNSFSLSRRLRIPDVVARFAQ